VFVKLQRWPRDIFWEKVAASKGTRGQNKRVLSYPRHAKIVEKKANESPINDCHGQDPSRGRASSG
jgi:hypothetical protein